MLLLDMLTLLVLAVLIVDPIVLILLLEVLAEIEFDAEVAPEVFRAEKGKEPEVESAEDIDELTMLLDKLALMSGNKV